MNFTIPIKRSLYTNPIAVFTIAWSVTFFLYVLQYSNILIYDRFYAFIVVSSIVFPFFIGAIISNIFNGHANSTASNILNISSRQIASATKYLRSLYIFWSIVTLAEIAYSGGLPIYWSLTGSYKTYFDFGIPTIHGFMNAILLSVVTISTFLALITNKKKYYLGVLFLVFWGVVVISRNLIIVGVLQCLFLMFLIKGPPRGKRVLGLTVLGLLAIVAFGWIGDLRSGADAFFALAQPSDNYPTFLPSGFLWVYIYITTPLNNLIHQTAVAAPEWDWGLTNSMALLLPSVIRNILYNSTIADAGELVTEAFNVSTAFVDMYRDLGFPGIMALSLSVGAISQAAYNGSSVRSLLFSAVLLQSAVLSIFFNHYFYLPILFQYPIIALISRRMRQGDSTLQQA